jgi:hypothetical protein
LSYLPDFPPVNTRLDSYDYKEWFSSLQRFFLNESGVLDIDQLTLGSTYEFPENVTIIHIGDDDISGTRFVFPIYVSVLGKIYILKAKDASPGALKIRHKTGDKLVGEATFTSDEDQDLDFTNYQDLTITYFATEDGWNAYYQPPVEFIEADAGSYVITGSDVTLTEG